MRATVSRDPAVRELQDQVRGRSGVMLGERWRAIQGIEAEAEALLIQRFAGGVWETVQAFGIDGQPLGGDPWHYVGQPGEPAFQNGWVNYGPTGGIGLTRFKKAAGIVHVQLGVKSGTVNTVYFTLPEGYRPDEVISSVWVREGGGDGMVAIAVDNAGNIVAEGETSNTITRGFFSFPADQ